MRYTFDCLIHGSRVATTLDKEEAKQWLIAHPDDSVEVFDGISKASVSISYTEIDAFADIGDRFITYQQGASITCSHNLAVVWSEQSTVLVRIHMYSTNKTEYVNIRGYAALANWRESLEKSTTWKPEMKDHINPPHYQALMAIPAGDIVVELQWLEHLQYHAHFRDPAVFKGAVEMQARKYMDRCGGKDAELQEMKKAIWYLKFLAAYVANGNAPIFVKDIHTLLEN